MTANTGLRLGRVSLGRGAGCDLRLQGFATQHEVIILMEKRTRATETQPRSPSESSKKS